ncbi:MAG: hypothetical protein IH968_01315 [Gemmatimonadetes bacterium]|nr:hypothetical protein [Gemmatimonadota bacterium]
MSHHTSPNPAEQPWLAESRWAGGRVRSTAPKELAVMWLFAVIWNALGSPLGWMVLKGDEDLGVFLAWVLPLFAFTGLALLIIAVRDTMRWRRFGGLAIELDPFPGSIGGHAGGSVELPLRPSDTFELSATLSCVHVRISKSSNNSSKWESVVWARQMVPEAGRSGTGVRARFTFELPEGLPETEEPSDSTTNGRCEWLPSCRAPTSTKRSRSPCTARLSRCWRRGPHWWRRPRRTAMISRAMSFEWSAAAGVSC